MLLLVLVLVGAAVVMRHHQAYQSRNTLDQRTAHLAAETAARPHGTSTFVVIRYDKRNDQVSTYGSFNNDVEATHAINVAPAQNGQTTYFLYSLADTRWPVASLDR